MKLSKILVLIANSERCEEVCTPTLFTSWLIGVEIIVFHMIFCKIINLCRFRSERHGSWMVVVVVVVYTVNSLVCCSCL